MINSTTEDGRVAQLNTSSIYCHTFYDITDPVVYSGGIPTAWKFSAELMNVSNGVHTVTVNNATTWPGNVSTNVRLSLLRQKITRVLTLCLVY